MEIETKLNDKETVEIQRIFDNVLLDEPENFLALYGKSLSLYKDGKMDESLEILNRAINLDTTNTDNRAKEFRDLMEKIITMKTDQIKIEPGLAAMGFNSRKSENLLIKSMILRQPCVEIKSADKSASSTKPKSYSCNICEKEFTKMFSLNRHMNLHTGKKPHKCSFCRKAFIQKTDKERHETTHSEVLNFSCTFDDCEKKFRTKKNLNCHLVTHSTERPFKCQFCPKDFKVKRLLKFHEGLHKDFKPFNCDICGRGFPAKPYLKSHLKTHLEDKPFECKICKYGFKRRYDLHFHMRNQHKQENGIM
jgi:uncharacterized Zn-finger protein